MKPSEIERGVTYEGADGRKRLVTGFDLGGDCVYYRPEFQDSLRHVEREELHVFARWAIRPVPTSEGERNG